MQCHQYTQRPCCTDSRKSTISVNALTWKAVRILPGVQRRSCSIASSASDGSRALASNLPLNNKRVMVTAPRQYAHKLCSKLIDAGARTLWVPGVSITALQPGKHQHQLDQALGNLISGHHTYTHIAFTSKNGIHAVLQRLEHLTGDVEAACDILRGCGAALCALGADGQVLAAAGLPVHISPKEASTQGLVRELESLGQASGAHVLCPVPLVTGGLTEPPVVPRFLAALEAAGAHATRLEAYVTEPGASPASCQAEWDLLQQGHVHAVAFSSTAEAQGLVHAMGGQGRLVQALKQHHVLLAAHGPYTAQGVSQVLDMPVTCVSANFHTFDGLVAAIEKEFDSRQSAQMNGRHANSTAPLHVLASPH